MKGRGIMGRNGMMAVAVAGLLGLVPAMAFAADAAMDAAAWRAVRDVRARAGLTDEALAAAGCSEAQAGRVLEQVAAWTATGHAAWAAKCNAVGEARARLLRAERRSRTGPRNPGLLARLPALRQALADRKAEEQASVEPLPARIGSVLAPSQRAVWTAARAGIEAYLAQ